MMNYSKFIFWLVFTIYWCDISFGESEVIQDVDLENKYRVNRMENTKSSYTVLSETITQAVNNENMHETCAKDDIDCLASTSNDPHGLEAIMALHKQLDDDANGNVDLSETGDFLREDLKLNSGYENRQKAFHYNDDMHISVKELWSAWLRSEVHNWTVEQTTEWLTFSVELPQYVPHFIRNKVAGSRLPQLAVNNNNYLSVLGIKDPIHKQKIALKAMDVVLFGPPKDGHHHWKDLSLIVLTIGGGIGLWYAYQQNKKFRRHLHRMNRDMEGLQSAEKALENLQKELVQAEEAKKNIVSEKENLEKRLQESDATGMHHSYSDLEVSQLKQEIEMLRAELQIAEGELKDRCWSAPAALQQWLQLTHEIENKSYVKKRNNAEKQLQHAREACDKLRKKRSSLVGAFVSTHGKSIDDVDRSIVVARTSLNEVTHELQERVHRWKQIEHLLGFSIINNNGLAYLENHLYRSYNGRALTLRNRISSQDELDDENSSIYAPSAGAGYREMESSGSETSRHEDDSITSASMQTSMLYTDIRQPSNSVHFLLGGEVTNWNEQDLNPKSAPVRTATASTPTPPHTTSNTRLSPTSTSSASTHATNNNNNNSNSNNSAHALSSLSSATAKQVSGLPPIMPPIALTSAAVVAAVGMTRSQSQDVHAGGTGGPEMGVVVVPLGATRSKASHSDTSLDRPPRHITTTTTAAASSLTNSGSIPSSRPQTISEQPISTTTTTSSGNGAIAHDEDVCSTDSSVIDSDDLRNKRKKRKFFGFTKKSGGKSKAD